MPATETLQPITPVGNQPPVDPNVVVPEHVKRAAAAAEAIHQQAYAAPEPGPAPAAPEPAPAAVAPEAPPQSQPEPAPQAPAAGDEGISAEEWRRRFLSMQGRFQQAQRQIGSLEQQMSDLAQELVRTQAMVSATPAHDGRQPGQHHGNLITNEDREAYGEELIDLVHRAARDTVGPELEALRAENQRLTSRMQHSGKRELFATLDREVPNWREINKSPQFLGWLRLPNIYTGQIRGSMLKAAVDGAEAPKVLALFRDFLTEAHATGNEVPAAQLEPPAPAPAPRVPAVDMAALAAPGKARPASGDGQVPPEKPIYTRASIAKFYDEKRRGLWAGREAEAAAIEQDLGAAQREGRIR